MRAQRGGDLVGALRHRQVRRIADRRPPRARAHAAARPSAPPRRRSVPIRPRVRACGAHARSGARAPPRRRPCRDRSLPCRRVAGDGAAMARILPRRYRRAAARAMIVAPGAGRECASRAAASDRRVARIEGMPMNDRKPRARRALRAAALLAAALGLGVAFAPSAGAATLRWAGRGDMQTTDPHSQNEILTNNINILVYETLVMRDKKLAIVPALAESWTQVNPTTWRFKLRRECPLPRRHAVHRRRCRLQLRAGARGHVAVARLFERVRRAETDRRPDGRVHDQRAESDRARARRQHQHHEPRLVREEQGDRSRRTTRRRRT